MQPKKCVERNDMKRYHGLFTIWSKSSSIRLCAISPSQLKSILVIHLSVVPNVGILRAVIEIKSGISFVAVIAVIVLMTTVLAQ